jgi:dUTP pyrophosphatase
MKVKIKKLHKNAVIPKYSNVGDAGMDMTAVTAEISADGLYVEYGTGIAVEIPERYVGLIFPRSSLSKTSLILSNHVGVVDSGYRGEIKFRFKDTRMRSRIEYGIDQYFCSDTVYKVGDRIGQLMIIPYPKIEFEEVEELDSTNRGEGGFGSTGK